MTLARLLFLSHLCGEEAGVQLSKTLISFLSHLCGDEGPVTGAGVSVSFLSHLCGDEGDAYRISIMIDLPKSPMR